MFERATGKTKRMRRILFGEKGRCLLVPLDQGANGVAMGRKIWQSEDPEAVVRSIKGTIFG